MEKDSTIAKGFLSSIIIVLSFVYQSFGILFVILLALMAMDYITGISTAILINTASSQKGIIGILKKVGYIFLVVCGTLFDMVIAEASKTIGTGLYDSTIFGTLIICWLISNELLSIMENLGKIGVPTPKFFLIGISKFKSMVDKYNAIKDDERNDLYK